MPEYRIRSTGEVLTDDQFRKRHKNTSFSRLLDENLLDAFDTDIVFEGPQKQGPPPYSVTYRDGVEQINGKWYTKYSIKQQDKEPIDNQRAENVRIKRDQLIKGSDWRAVSDRELEPEWKEYRQALRDITKQEGFPHDIEWPVDPDGNGGDSMHG
tara:strand:- start:1394 stop:1858 length:465 start_codon:yes stop_codon:yes gene_type:complete